MFGILEGSDFLVTIKKQGSQQRTVKLHKNIWKVLFLTEWDWKSIMHFFPPTERCQSFNEDLKSGTF